MEDIYTSVSVWKEMRQHAQVYLYVCVFIKKEQEKGKEACNSVLLLLDIWNHNCLAMSHKPSTDSRDAPTGQGGSCSRKMLVLPLLLDAVLKSCGMLGSSKQRLWTIHWGFTQMSLTWLLIEHCRSYKSEKGEKDETEKQEKLVIFQVSGLFST